MTTRIATTLATTCEQHAQLGRTSTQATSPSLPLSSIPSSQTSALQQHPPPTQRDPRLSLTPWTLASETSPPNVPPTMSLFLKPKDEHTARVICDLRPLTACIPATHPPFPFPRYRAWSPPPAGGPNATSPSSTSVPTSTPSHSRRRIFAVSALPACLLIASSSITSSSLGHGSAFLLGGAGRRLWRKHKCSTW